MKTHTGCGGKDPHKYTATALGRGMVASPMLGRPLSPGKAPGTHFIVG